MGMTTQEGGGAGYSAGIPQAGSPGRPGDGLDRTNGLPDEQLARALGWFSLGLGLAGLAAPGDVARAIGVRDDDNSRSMLRAVGLREIVSGLGILTQPRPAGWLWSRVAGDVMDLTLLTRAMESDENTREKVAAATAAVAGITAVDVWASQQLSRKPGTYQPGGRIGPLHLLRSLTIARPVEEIYTFWRDFRNLPRFMTQLESVEMLDERRSHWRAKGPAGIPVEWDAEMTADRPSELIAWQTVGQADVASSGVVRFKKAPGDRGTEVQVEMRYAPPGGMLGDKMASFFGKDPGQMLLEDLRTLKRVLETGEIVRSDGALYGATFPQRPARPASEAELQLGRRDG